MTDQPDRPAAATGVTSTPLGSVGLTATNQGLGCMGMSEFYGEADDATSTATLDTARELGVTFWDTADVYGPHTNEQLLGAYFRTTGSRDDITLATKFGIVRDPDDPTKRGFNGRPEYVRACCDASLSRLGVDHIDLYYQHRVDPSIDIEETWGAMAELVEAGKVRFLGISEAAPATVRRAHAVHPISAIQSEWSLWSREIEDEIVPLARELGIGIVPYSPLGRGFLTGQITTEDDFEPGDFRRGMPRFTGDNFKRNLDLVAAVTEMANDHDCTPGQLALAWLHAQGRDVHPIPGTKRPTYLRQNAEAASISLSAADLDRLDEISPKERVAGDRYADMRFVNGQSR
jgi:aryl-alcohol dehydrogenase-like predicted oxidoreductase